MNQSDLHLPIDGACSECCPWMFPSPEQVQSYELWFEERKHEQATKELRQKRIRRPPKPAPTPIVSVLDPLESVIDSYWDRHPELTRLEAKRAVRRQLQLDVVLERLS